MRPNMYRLKVFAQTININNSFISDSNHMQTLFDWFS